MKYAESLKIEGFKGSKLSIEGSPDALVYEIPAYKTKSDKVILFYGHYDKQPHFTGWREGLGPVTPVREGSKSYGRGISDDGYASYAAVLAIQALRKFDLPHPKCLMLFEGEEESGSPHLMQFLEKLGKIDLLIGLDSGAGNYDTCWLTASLRGSVKGKLTVKTLENGMHSGEAGGIVPNPFNILR